jgi:hypothetical protein
VWAARGRSKALAVAWTRAQERGAAHSAGLRRRRQRPCSLRQGTKTQCACAAVRVRTPRSTAARQHFLAGERVRTLSPCIGSHTHAPGTLRDCRLHKRAHGRRAEEAAAAVRHSSWAASVQRRERLFTPQREGRRRRLRAAGVHIRWERELRVRCWPGARAGQPLEHGAGDAGTAPPKGADAQA